MRPAECSLNIRYKEKIVTSLDLHLAPVWADLVSVCHAWTVSWPVGSFHARFWQQERFSSTGLKIPSSSLTYFWTHLYPCRSYHWAFPFFSPSEFPSQNLLTNISNVLWVRNGRFSFPPLIWVCNIGVSGKGFFPWWRLHWPPFRLHPQPFLGHVGRGLWVWGTACDPCS